MTGANRGRLTLNPLGTTAHLTLAARNDPALQARQLYAEAHSDHLRGWLVKNADGEWCLLASAGTKWSERPLVARKAEAAAKICGIKLD